MYDHSAQQRENNNMLIDTLNLTEGSTSTNLIIPSGTQAARLALLGSLMQQM